MAKSFQEQVTICNKRGLHARAAAKFVTAASRFASKITVTKDELEVSGRSIMGLLLLAAAEGEAITISASGHDAAEALERLASLVKTRFEELD